MDDLALARIARRLIEGGVAPRHVRRLLREVHDHRGDLMQQLGLSPHDADRELGDPDALVTAVLARPELRSWTHRYPWLLLTIAPVVLMGATAVAVVSGFAGFLALAKWVTGGADDSMDVVWRFAHVIMPPAITWGAPLLAAALILLLALRSRLQGWVWPVVGLMVIALLSGAVNSGLDLPKAPGEQGFMTVGIGFPGNFDPFRSALLAALPIALYFGLRRRARVETA